MIHVTVIDSVEENFIPLETNSKATIPVTPSEPEGSKGKGKRYSECLITAKRWTPNDTQRNRKPQNSASIQGKPTLTACTGKITVIYQVVISKSKFPKEADSKFVQGTVKETLVSKGTRQRTEKAFPEAEDLEEDTLDTVVDFRTMREIIPTLPLTFKLNKNIKLKDWKDMDQVLQLHQLLKDLFQWSMDNQSFNLESHWAELGASCQKICLKEVDFRDPMLITKGCNPTRQFRLLEEPTDQLPRVTILHNPRQFPGEEKDKRDQKDHLQQKEERVRPKNPENVGFVERSAQELEVVVHYSRISSPVNRNITPTQIEHNVVTAESNLKSDAL
ncbi:hypothetical protein O181_064237 [Austropuccinia psidii MF-1]|uniref:Uncharacterized protein n=1 Tax=Austropuccinia psidii MF-1 TaxID=1389203 RepID=A0A9Q3EVE0_9BASI|nr:hypothetical protein [Austropuccinia psidii MF-1]